MVYKTEITVRHYECDAYGHVNNAKYLNYLDIYTKAIKIKKARGVFCQEIKQDETLICEAEVTWASIGKDGNISTIPEELDVPGLYPGE